MKTERRQPIHVEKIISGGQTGVDRAALDYALAHGVPHGGYCPKGRRALDGPLPAKYLLEETRTGVYSERTEKNLSVADGTLVIYDGVLTGGTQLTVELCRRFKKPLFLFNWNDPPSGVEELFTIWVTQSRIRTLNVAGPRDTPDGFVYQKAMKALEKLGDCFKPRN